MSRRGLSAPRWFVLGFALLLAAGACAPDDDGVAGSPTPPDTPAPDQSCEAPQYGYRIHFPDDWHVNDIEQAKACSWFHPEPFELPEHTEVTEVAVMLAVEDGSFEERAHALTDAPDVAEVLSEEEVTVAGEQAVRAETERSGEAFYPEGTTMTTYLVDWDDQILSAVTTSVADGEYASNVDVLDEMMDSLERVEFEATCSAAALNPEPTEQPDLPEIVAETRERIVERAVACDFEGLAQIAEGSDADFTFSFGNGGDPAEFWARSEQDELERSGPMLYLAALLDRPHETRSVEGRTQYLWPSAFAYDSWDEVPDEDREALRPLYTELELRGFQEFGSYGGYRIGIDADGNWLFFVAGD